MTGEERGGKYDWGRGGVGVVKRGCGCDWGIEGVGVTGEERGWV